MAELRKISQNVEKDTDKNTKEQIKTLENNATDAKQINNGLRKRKEGIIKEKTFPTPTIHRFPEQRVHFVPSSAY